MGPWDWCRLLLHRRWTSLAKTALLLFAASFVWLQLRVASISQEFLTHKAPDAEDVDFFANFSSYSGRQQNASNWQIASSPVHLRKLVQRLNQVAYVANREKLGPLKEGDPVIVVQVHNRVQYLYALIESLRKTRGINRTLLIFSHDLYNQNINELIKEVDFCKVLQIFYPYSIQMYPKEFPGEDPNDCPRDAKRPEALKMRCNNAPYPDSYGHYREARFTQTKHHWWWKLNHIMDGVSATRNHNGPFLFLEEDHYVAPDVLHFLALMLNIRKTSCLHCSILCLGTYVKTFSYSSMGRHVEHLKWHSSKHNMGMVFDRNLWLKIKNCSRQFCTFDDYNWDWSLQHLSATCLPSPLVTLVAVAPRVFHIGECGVHHKGKDCSSAQVVKRVMGVLKSAALRLFPSSLTLRQGHLRPMKPPKGNGGWGDQRDRRLCLQHANLTLVAHPLPNYSSKRRKGN